MSLRENEGPAGPPACPDARAIAIYDLDRTITRAPTFTQFLLFVARREAPWRLALIPLWVIALIGYRIALYGRETLKPFGIRLFVGGRIAPARAERLARAFADMLESRDGYRPGALRQIEADRQAGAMLVLSTAAPEFYAEEIARRLGFDACLATRHERCADGGYRADIAGRNNYGGEKWRRIEAWLMQNDIARAGAVITAYSDHASDRPLFDNADRAFFVFCGKGKPMVEYENLDWR